MRLAVPCQIPQQDTLSFGANEDHPLVVMMLGLVTFRNIVPDVLRPVDITRSNEARFIRTAAGEPLELGHVRHHLWEVREGGFPNIIRERQDRMALNGLASALT